MRTLVWMMAAATALAACETAPPAPAPVAQTRVAQTPIAQAAEPPTYQWRVEDRRIGEILVSAWRDGEWFRVSVRGRWPARDPDTGESLSAASSVKIFRVHAERSAEGAWRTLNSINLETIQGRWRPDQPFEFETRYPALTLEHPEQEGFAYFCMGTSRWCYLVNLVNTDDPAAPWSEPPLPSHPPPARGNQIADRAGDADPTPPT
jgi:hypothetical protein